MLKKTATAFVTWTLFCVLFSSLTTACDNGWFGSSCQYKCHCTNNNCDENGSCKSGSKCVDGWFGPACQYVKIATRGTSSVQRNLRYNDDTTCIDDEMVQGVNISLEDSTPFTWMRIQFKDPDQVPLFNVQFKPHEGDSIIDCKNLRNATVTKTSMDIHCDLDVAVDEVILKGEGVKSLCSISFSGGRNVALNQNTSQSSNFRPSERAVDGDIDTFTHTAFSSSIPNLNVTLKQPKLVKRYRLYNRQDCCQERLKGFFLRSFAEDGSIVFSYRDKEPSDLKVYNVISVDVKKTVSRVMIQTFNKDKDGIILSVGEVELFGESVCPDGMYGLECDQVCNCDKGKGCFVSTGGCPTGCASGYHGEDCKTECPPKFHGIGCEENCSKSCLNELCNATTGVCTKCIPGKKGDKCQTECLDKFGLGCRYECSSSCTDVPPNERVCDPVSGTCARGCKDGYLGLTCNETCSTGKYGSGCNFTCSNSCGRNAFNESVCHHETGQCLLGCIGNYQGNMCLQEVPSDDDEDSIPVIIGVVVACLLVLMVVVGIILLRKRRNPKPARQPDNDSIAEFPVIDRVSTSNVNSDLTKSNTNDNKSKNTDYNMMKGLENTAIAVEDLNDFMMSHDRQFFEDQVYKIPANSDVAMTVGLSLENNHKNRYKNVCAFDHSRVHLKADASKKHGDYINASFIEGYKDQEKFIASQGPNKVMIDDFIRMLWEQKTEKVVMLTNLVEDGKLKCERYWPEKDEIKFGEIKVKLTTTDQFADYTIRRLQLSKPGQLVQELTQFHFTSWPDKDAPNTPWSLIDFEQRVSLQPTDKPVVVHCSAGVGRTGTFIALRNVMSQAEATGSVNFFSTLHKLRQERMMMIQTLSQYIFLHKAAQVAIVCMQTTVTTDDITDRMKTLESDAGKDGTKMNKEFKAICSLCQEAKEEEKEADTEEEKNVYQNNPSNNLKNRFQDIVPSGQHRPILTCDNSDMSDYINAVFVPSLTEKDKNLLTQLPLPTTISDFWRMVTQYKVSLIVAFEVDLKDKDKTIIDYLPPTEGEPVSCPPFDIQTGPVTLGDCWEKQKLRVTKLGQKKHRLSLSHSHTDEHQLTSLKCTTTDLIPKSMLALMKEIRSNTSAGVDRTVFVCRNGAEYSGLVCALSLLLDRMDHDQRLAVPLVVRTIKTIRPQVISTESQYKFLYQVLQRYSQTQSSYSNLGKSSFKSAPGKGIPNSAPIETKKDPNHVYANTVN